MHREKAAPFRLFFMLAALDAMLGGMVWTPPGQAIAGMAEIAAGEWHRNVLMFGTVPAVLAGFLLTALPRWTRRDPVSSTTVRLLAGVWLLGRMAFLACGEAAGLALFACFVLLLMFVLAKAILAARDRRNLKILLLLAAYLVAIAMTVAGWQLELAVRMALATMLGLVMIVGGRVVPALTEAYLQKMGRHASFAPSAAIEKLAAFAAASALAGWVAAPQAQLTGLACALAALAQLARLVQWRGWHTRASAAMLVLHIGYGWIVVGFVLLAAHAIAPAALGRPAGVHAWTIGAVGTMSLGIMASMARKHAGSAFVSCWQATAAFLAVSTSAVARLLAEGESSLAWFWIPLSGTLWIAAFALFIVALARMPSMESAARVSSSPSSKADRVGRTLPAERVRPQDQ